MKLRPSFVLFLALCLLPSCDEYIAVSGYAQGGIYTVKLNLRGDGGRKVKMAPEDIKAGIDSIINLVDTTFSGYNKSSLLSRWNAGENVRFNGIFKELYDFSYALYTSSSGAFNVAAGPVFDLWGFGFTSDSLERDPDALRKQEEAVRQVLPTIGMPEFQQLEDGQRHPRLNFNAVAQGYTCDLVAGWLRGLGVKDMLVDIGEIFCQGLNPSRKPWSVGIDRPVDGNNIPGADLDGIWQSDGGAYGVVTSGNYRKFYIRDGKNYAHTIDPRTGWPVTHNLLSATIIAPDATTADAYATYCMVIGLDASREFVESQDGIEAYLIYDDEGTMREWRSKGFTLR